MKNLAFGAKSITTELQYICMIFDFCHNHVTTIYKVCRVHLIFYSSDYHISIHTNFCAFCGHLVILKFSSSKKQISGLALDKLGEK